MPIASRVRHSQLDMWNNVASLLSLPGVNGAGWITGTIRGARPSTSPGPERDEKNKIN